MNYKGLRIPDVLYTKSGREISVQRMFTAMRRHLRDDHQAMMSSAFEVFLYYPIVFKSMRLAGRDRLSPATVWPMMIVYQIYMMFGRKVITVEQMTYMFPTSTIRTRKSLSALCRRGYLIRHRGSYELTPIFFLTANTIMSASREIIEKYTAKRAEHTEWIGLQDMIPK